MAWTTATTRSSGFAVTAAVWNSEHVDNMNFLKEVNYTAFTSPVSITAPTQATAQQIVTSGAIRYDAVPTLIEFFSPAANAAADGTNLILTLFDGSTAVGRLEQNASVRSRAVKLEHRLTPTAASHPYNVKGHTGSGTGTVSAGAGGSDTLLPGFIRITRVPT